MAKPRTSKRWLWLGAAAGAGVIAVIAVPLVPDIKRYLAIRKM